MKRLWQTANAVSASQGAPLELFERMGYVFTQLHGCERYVNIPTGIRMGAIVEVLTEVLCILAIATKEINQNRASEFTFEPRIDSFGLLFNRNIPEETSKKEGYRGCHTEARKSDSWNSRCGGYETYRGWDKWCQGY